jgi:uncharacterized protein (DUF2062 family)
MNVWLRQVHRTLVERILGLEDTPHRIAWGVFLGSVIGFSPTVGVQMVLYFAAASLFRANKVSGIPAVWISNPVTMVPLYYGLWRLGAVLLGRPSDPERGRELIHEVAGASEFSWSSLTELAFWERLWNVLWSIGAELWLGGLVVGLAFGAVAYGATLFGVRAYRRALARAEAAEEPSRPSRPPRVGASKATS